MSDLSHLSYSSTLRFDKIKSADQLAAAGQHNERTKIPPNADAQRIFLNKTIIGAGHTIPDLVNSRLAACQITPRKNAVIALEFVISAGPQFFKSIKSETEWCTGALDQLRENFGADNLVHAIIHYDETTPHLHAIVLPIIAANYKDGRVYRSNKTAKWKLDAKGIFEKMAGQRDTGLFDRAACLIRCTDILIPRAIIRSINLKSNPFASWVASKLPQPVLNSLADTKLKQVAKIKILVPAFNQIISGPLIYDSSAFNDIILPSALEAAVKSTPAADDLLRINRQLLDAGFDKLILPCGPRARQNPTQPFLHQMQKRYYEFCKSLDPNISEPLYGAKMAHVEFSKHKAALEAAKVGLPLLKDFTVNLRPNSPLTLEVQAQRESSRLQSLVKPLIAVAAQGQERVVKAEEFKAAIRRANQTQAATISKLELENQQLREEVERLRKNAELREVPLEQVLETLTRTRLKPVKQNQYPLPDNRVIEINQNAFVELTGRYGLGQMSKRKRGKGALDLTMFVTGCSFATAQKWLANKFSKEKAWGESFLHLKYQTEIIHCETIDSALTEPEETLFLEQPRIPYIENHGQWGKLKENLVTTQGFAAEIIDELNQGKMIFANAYGALVCQMEKILTAYNLVPINALEPVAFDFASNLDKSFEIGSPNLKLKIIVASPLEAIACYQLSNRIAQVLAINGKLRDQDLEKMNPDNLATIILAHDRSSAGDDMAALVQEQLQAKGFATIRMQPPTDLGWNNVIRLTKGKFTESSKDLIPKAERAASALSQFVLNQMTQHLSKSSSKQK